MPNWTRARFGRPCVAAGEAGAGVEGASSGSVVIRRDFAFGVTVAAGVLGGLDGREALAESAGAAGVDEELTSAEEAAEEGGEEAVEGVDAAAAAAAADRAAGVRSGRGLRERRTCCGSGSFRLRLLAVERAGGRRRRAGSSAGATASPFRFSPMPPERASSVAVSTSIAEATIPALSVRAPLRRRGLAACSSLTARFRSEDTASATEGTSAAVEGAEAAEAAAGGAGAGEGATTLEEAAAETASV